MAIEFEQGEEYDRAGFFSAAANDFSCAGWVLIVSAPNQAYSNFFGMNAEIVVGTLGSSNQMSDRNLNIGLAANDFRGTTVLALDVWYHVALVRNGTTKTAWLNGVQECNGTDAATGSTALEINSFDGSTDLPNRYAALKLWDGVVLTEAEIRQEMRQYLPVRTAGLRGFYPFHSLADDEIDFSGNGQTLSTTGTPAYADGPPIPWAMGRHRVTRTSESGPPPTPPTLRFSRRRQGGYAFHAPVG